MGEPWLCTVRDTCRSRRVVGATAAGRRSIACSGGTASVEFAIVVPVLLLILFAIIGVASVLYIHVNMENAAREAARRMAVAEATFSGAAVTCDQAPAQVAGSAENYACTYLANWGALFTVTANEVCPAREVVVTIEADASRAALGDIFGFFIGRTLTAEVVMRKEAECT